MTNPKKKPTKNYYFGPEVEDAISEYLKSESKFTKERIFNKTIYPALNKLAENVIHDRKFYNYGYDEYINIKHDLVVYLHERLNRFDAGAGHKAFSYFNRISINWVFANMRRVAKETYGKVEVVEIDNNRDLDSEQYNTEYLDELRDFCLKWSSWGNNNLEYLFFEREGKIVDFSPADKKVANAIFNLFQNSHSIDIYDKKALYIMIREQVNTKTQRITDVVKVLKPLCYDMYMEFKKNGTRYWHRFLYYPEKYTDKHIY